jgi:hypothetical protein
VISTAYNVTFHKGNTIATPVVLTKKSVLVEIVALANDQPEFLVQEQ